MKPLFSRAVRTVTWDPVTGCGCRSRATRRVTPERLPGRHGPARELPSRSAGHGRESVIATAYERNSLFLQRTCPSRTGPKCLAAKGSRENRWTRSRTAATFERRRVRSTVCRTPSGDDAGLTDKGIEPTATPPTTRWCERHHRATPPSTAPRRRFQPPSTDWSTDANRQAASHRLSRRITRLILPCRQTSRSFS